MSSQNIINLKWSINAINNVEYYYDWYLYNSNKNVADKFLNTIENAVSTIKSNPYIARQSLEKPRLRKYVVRKYPFLISYTIKDESNILITFLLHAKINYKCTFKIFIKCY